MAPAASTSSSRPASTSRRWCRTACSRARHCRSSRTSRTSTRSTRTRRGIPDNKYSVLQGLGLDRLDLRQHRDHRADQDLERLHRRRDERGERPDVGARHRRRTSRASTSGPTASTGPPTTRRSSTRARTSSSTSSPSTQGVRLVPGHQPDVRELRLSQVVERRRAPGASAPVDDPSKYTWGLGAPTTELWMDNWCIVKGAPNLDAAYAFINFILDPENSVMDLEFHGYNTGVEGIEALLPPTSKFLDMIFFTPEQVKTMDAGVDQQGPGPPRRHLQQGEGEGRSVDARSPMTATATPPVTVEERSAPPPESSSRSHAEVRPRDPVVGLVPRVLRRPRAGHRLVQLRLQAARQRAARGRSAPIISRSRTTATRFRTPSSRRSRTRSESR